MKGPESFGAETPNNKNEEARPAADGIEVDELPVKEKVEMEGTAEEQAARAELQKALDNTDVVEHKADVIEMKGPAPSAEEDDVDKAA